MENAELGVFLLNLVIVLVAYFLVYPKIAGSDINKISLILKIRVNILSYIFNIGSHIC